ncbi:SDR family oxidoreductase [Reyranella sp. CPCC 100927]|uniref:SDR family oxidoreductase n=1 Tax=Reyranella sp. CPCC 100927 TaxID=2599616 RepID=UPI0011B56599|nr:SDR family oxidoreductase [Reyranella sp. CPCC 100927]TWT15092.1 SDR family oxidoreductase [Reyranella sp. CPCC 100927]
MDASRLFIFGFGDTAAQLAHEARKSRYTVIGTVRTVDKLRALRDAGHEIVRFASDGPLDAPAQALAGITHLLCSIPPDAEGDPAALAHADDVARHASGLRWIGYLSTTGVYGDHGGAWIDETTPVAPISDRARRRVAAEQQWQALGERLRVPTFIFRLPGIYGPGRSALDQVRAGTARRIARPGQVFSRIHIEDIATTVLASMRQPDASAIYNVADDEPSAQADVVAFAYTLLGLLPPPPVDYADIEASLPPMARSFYAESRRMKNDRIKRDLGVTLAYPTYREGLRAIHAGGG